MRYRPDATQFLSSGIFSDHADASTDGQTLLPSLSSFFTFYSRFNKGTMIIAIEINKRYRYDEIRLLSEGWLLHFCFC